MSNIHLTDNDSKGRLIDDDRVQDILCVEEIGKLQNAPDLLVFPHSFSERQDGIGELSILTTKEHHRSTEGHVDSLRVCTGNLMGFVGINDTSISIHSRFTHKKENGVVDETGKDYFLYYMLQKVFSLNVFSLEHSSNHDDKILDFLLFLFPYMLKKALSQGLYKEYRSFDYDDSRVRGTIDVARFIRNDIPFKGGVSYRAREHSYDNSLTQLIRHTIEFVKHHPLGASILKNDQETIDSVSQIVMATPTYNQRQRESVLNANRKPKVHPYFLNYRELQQLCVRILRHESLKYGKEKDKVYGVLFDGAWLWEEYLNTVLHDIGFKHPENKRKAGGIRMFMYDKDEDTFDKNSRKMYPDFYKHDYILDAKYKHLYGEVGREDLYQVVSYMYCMDVPFGGYLYPDEYDQDVSIYKLAGRGGQYDGLSGGVLRVIPFKVPQKSPNWNQFIDDIKDSERKLIEIDLYKA